MKPEPVARGGFKPFHMIQIYNPLSVDTDKRRLRKDPFPFAHAPPDISAVAIDRT